MLHGPSSCYLSRPLEVVWICWFKLSLGADSHCTPCLEKLDELAMKDALFLVLSLPLGSTKGPSLFLSMVQNQRQVLLLTGPFMLLLGWTLRC